MQTEDFFRRSMRGLLNYSAFNTIARIVAQETSIHLHRRLSGELKRTLVSRLRTGASYEVIRGPFQGLVCPPPEGRGRHWLTILLGSYEQELHSTISVICNQEYRYIVNIGGGCGYYGIGLALKFPDTPVTIFESDEKACKSCMEMACLNGVTDRVEVLGTCNAESLGNSLATKGGARTLIVSDCEGGELDILSPAMLVGCDILVELHDQSTSGPTISEIFQHRFDETHKCVFVNPRKRNPQAYPELQCVKPFEKLAILDEQREYSVGWMFLQARA